GSAEILVGNVLKELIDAKRIQRDEIVIITKAGYIQGKNLKLYLEKNFTTLDNSRCEQGFDIGAGNDCLANYQKLMNINNLWQTLEKIPTKFREVLLMIEYEGMSPEEVASITSSNINTVRWRLFRAKELLRNILKSQGVLKEL
ncbi:MAG: sigma factor-like helix-turn-helix DNA-binding protein, partial [Planctomycetota bacterium]